jgi:hypothetical protein
MSSIVGASPRVVKVHFGRRVEDCVHPILQVSMYKFHLRDQCRKHKQLSNLVNRRGRHTGKFHSAMLLRKTIHPPNASPNSQSTTG